MATEGAPDFLPASKLQPTFTASETLSTGELNRLAQQKYGRMFGALTKDEQRSLIPSEPGYDRLLTKEEGEMRDGEIVRTIDGHIARVSQLDWGIDEAEVGSYGWYTINSLGIVTVAELFEAAGCPIPADCIYAEATGSLAAFREISPDDCGNRQAHRFLLETIHTASESRHEWVHDGTWRPNRLIDLSRLPALDAWDALPNVIKAVVK